MNTAQIVHALEQDPVTNKAFCGVFPSDKLPQTVDKYPCGFIVNTDPSNKPGTHWLGFYFPSKHHGEFFDSYGHPPEYYHKSFKDYLDSYDWIFNKRKLQSNWTNVCGQYCMFYLSHRARRYSLNKIVNMFANDTLSNDTKVFEFVSNHFNMLAKVHNKKLNQSSRKHVEN